MSTEIEILLYKEEAAEFGHTITSHIDYVSAMLLSAHNIGAGGCDLGSASGPAKGKRMTQLIHRSQRKLGNTNE